MHACTLSGSHSPVERVMTYCRTHTWGQHKSFHRFLWGRVHLPESVRGNTYLALALATAASQAAGTEISVVEGSP